MIHSGPVRYHDDLAQLLTPIDDLKQHPDNPNNGDIDAIAESIDTNGMYRPIFVQKDTGWIIAGNHTWEACKMLGADEIPVVYLDVDNRTAAKIMLADNRTAALAIPDPALLLNLMHDHLHDDLLGTGYSTHDLDVLEHLAAIPLSRTDEFAQWPVLHFRIPPHVKKAFDAFTSEADTDREKFELLLRLAGWDPSSHDDPPDDD